MRSNWLRLAPLAGTALTLGFISDLEWKQFLAQFLIQAGSSVFQFVLTALVNQWLGLA